jgi:hypothetical protein
MRSVRSRLAGFVVLASALIGPRVAAASDRAPFQRPPVPVSFFSHQAGWIEFLYPPSARERVNPLIAQADEVRTDLGKVFGPPLLDGVEVRVARGPDEMASFAPSVPAGSQPSKAVRSSAITYPALKLVVLSLGDPGSVQQGELGDAFRRELGRVALHQAMRGPSVPAWFAEGFAIEFAGERTWVRRWLLFKAAVRRAIAPLDVLDDLSARGGPEAALAVAEAGDFVGFLLDDEKRGRFTQCALLVRKGEPFAGALAAAYGKTSADLEKAWRTDLDRRCLTEGTAAVAAVPAASVIALAAGRWLKRRKTRRDAKKGAAHGSGAVPEQKPVRIVFSRREEGAEPPPIVDAEVPRVEHDGEWHTLH